MLPVAVLSLVLGFGFAAYLALEGLQQKSVVRASLRRLPGGDPTDQRDNELRRPLGERAVAPLLVGLTQLGRRFTPGGYVDSTRRRLTSLGAYGPEPLDRFLAFRVLTVAAVPVVVILSLVVLPLDGKAPVLVAGLLSLALLLGPDALLNRRVEERQHAVQVKLPDILDLLTISVEAGLGFEQALDRTVAAVPGPLSDEFARMLGEVRAGATRADALRALDQRVDVAEVRSFVLAILQADTFGVSIGRMLRAQADEMRVKRRQLAQERAQKAPVKMLIPMVFCIFPALFVVVIGPAAVNIARTF